MKPNLVCNASLDRQADFVKDFEQFQTKALKYLLGCPKSTSPTIVRLLSGIEPLSSRFDLLKLRYFWRISHGDENNIAVKIYNKRRKHFLATKLGFIHEVFNLCCKYNVIDFWHGKLPRTVNPNYFIKNKVKKYHLTRELQIGRSKSCGFTDVYLQNKFLYQEDFQLVEPLKTFDFFSSTRARSLMIKVLLYPRVFKVNCELCNDGFFNIFEHYVSDCTHLENHRRKLKNMLNFYDFPMEHILNRAKFLKTCLKKNSWTKFLTDFLEDACF